MHVPTRALWQTQKERRGLTLKRREDCRAQWWMSAGLNFAKFQALPVAAAISSQLLTLPFLARPHSHIAGWKRVTLTNFQGPRDALSENFYFTSTIPKKVRGYHSFPPLYVFANLPDGTFCTLKGSQFIVRMLLGLKSLGLKIKKVLSLFSSFYSLLARWKPSAIF